MRKLKKWKKFEIYHKDSEQYVYDDEWHMTFHEAKNSLQSKGLNIQEYEIHEMVFGLQRIHYTKENHAFGDKKMGWADCGYDSLGRPIGYAFEAKCDQTGCEKQIDRGLGYACGGMHGETEHGCEKYFCYDHLLMVETMDNEYFSVCKECFELLEKSGKLKL